VAPAKDQRTETLAQLREQAHAPSAKRSFRMPFTAAETRDQAAACRSS
jgi:hypothetical protein